MKPKDIQIIYMPNGDFKSQVFKEIVFSKVLTELREEGRKLIDNTPFKFAKFDDGSRVSVRSLDDSLTGFPATQTYVDKAILDLPNGEEIIETKIAPYLIAVSGNYEVADANNRILIFDDKISAYKNK